MRDLAGSVAIVTGASRGIGVQIAEELARRGVRLALAARSGEELRRVSRAIEDKGARVVAIPTDVADPAALDHLVAETSRVFGGIDLLINNAGVVLPSTYERISLEEVERHLAVNLAAPMTLTRRVLPLMLERDRGHIVNMGSLGGLLGVGWGEPYGASKHGIVGFTRALRASCRASGSRVSASVICPGFIDAVGMYADSVRQHGHRAPISLGTSRPEAVVEATLQAIEGDLPEVIVSSRPVRLVLAINAISPRLGEWMCRKMGTHLVFRAIAEANEAGAASAHPGGLDPE
jgi:short-subunit dehydrogenase